MTSNHEKRTTKYEEPIAEILDISLLSDSIITVLRVDRLLSSPLAPGGLYSCSNPHQEILQLHRLLKQVDDVLSFKTYGLQSKLPSKGEKCIFRAWWTQDALDLVTNSSLVWTREKYPDDGTHAPCPLTYETISAYYGEREGYRSGNIWITVKAYERFIRDDILRLRRKSDEFS